MRPTLPDADVRALVALAKGGDVAARNRVIEVNMGLAFELAKCSLARRRSFVFSREDLAHYGVFGIAKAIAQFDPDFGAYFSTFAAYKIRQAIQRARQLHEEMVRRPVHHHKIEQRARAGEPVAVSPRMAALVRDVPKHVRYDESFDLSSDESRQLVASRRSEWIDRFWAGFDALPPELQEVGWLKMEGYDRRTIALICHRSEQVITKRSMQIGAEIRKALSS